MKSSGWILLTVLLLALAIVAVAPAHSAPADPTSSCTATEGGYHCLYGPVKVPHDEMVQFEDFFTPPPEAGYLTSARATLVDSDGDRIAHHMVHLHHAVWLNPNKTDTTCDSFGGYPNWDRFFASGKERTRLAMPDGYGYHWDNQTNPITNTKTWLLVAHLDGMHGEDDVYIRLDLGFVPDAAATGFVDIDPIWLDVKNCEFDPVFDVHKGAGTHGRFRKSWTYVMPESGEFVAMAGHLHDGGLRLVLRDETSDSHLFTSIATYGNHHEPWYLTEMSAFSATPGLQVNAGDQLKLTAVYDSTHRWDDVMGIMVGALATP